jgi:hypothetical protein
MNSMAASCSHDRVSLIVQGARAVFALTYGSNYIPAADLTAAGLQYVTDVSDDWSRICMQVQRSCRHPQPLLLFFFLPSSYTTRRHQTAAAEFTLLCNFPFVLHDFQYSNFVFASFYVTAAAQSHPIGRVSVCQLHFGSRLLLFLCSTARRFVMRLRGFFRQRMHFSRLAAHTCLCNRTSVFCLTFCPCSFGRIWRN